MNALYSLLAVVMLVLAVAVGTSVAGLQWLFGMVIPCVAVTVFILGIIIKVWKWATVPVPFCIPTVCGQQKSLPWIKYNPLESPPNKIYVLARMALEVLTFRSLFRNTKFELTEDRRLIYGTGSSQLLWLAAMAFHWCFLIILLRHLRFVTEPVLCFVPLIQELDGFLQIGAPRLYLTSIIIVVALGFLFVRRIMTPQLRYISLPSDYFALFLLLGVTISGDLMRYFTKVDVVKVKELVMGLVTFQPDLSVLQEIGLPFYIHLFLVSVLVAYLPFSKMMHMAGVFLSPTRNLANDSRVRRHINPWNPDVDVHTYDHWEEEFKDKLIAAEIPLERD